MKPYLRVQKVGMVLCINLPLSLYQSPSGIPPLEGPLHQSLPQQQGYLCLQLLTVPHLL